MLKTLYINNYALIHEAKIEFDSKLITLTGESGAGKSIMINALATVLGDRANHSVIRVGAEKCVIEVVFGGVSKGVKSLLKSKDYDVYEELHIRRELTSAGRSRAFINDTPANLSTVREIADELIDIYSQHEYASLNKSSFQIDYLDAFAGNKDDVLAYTRIFEELRSVSEELDSLTAKEAQVRKDRDYIQFQFDELSAATIEQDSVDDLENRLDLLENAEAVISSLNSVDHLLTGERTIKEMLAEALNAIKAVRNSNSEIDQLGSRLETLSHEVSDISYDLNKIVDQVEIDPQKTRELQDRLNELNTLLHKHGKDSIEELKALAQTYEAQLLESVNFKDDLEALQIKKDEILKEAIAVAKAISDRRKKATKKFEAEVEEVLSKLGMEKSQFKVHISDSKKLYINGLDQVEFMIDANSSGTLNPVSKVASGGEMARLMLALKAVGRTQESKCQVFDEIDTGVSGEVANRIGLLMKKLSEKTQCLAITHLPGVAAKGHQHLKVYKTEVDGIVQTKVESLNEDARIEELATMFSGNKLTESALETARTMRAEID